MAGILKRLQRKGGPKATTIAAQMLLRRSEEGGCESTPESEQALPPETDIKTVALPLGQAERLLADLKAESRAIAKRSRLDSDVPISEAIISQARTAVTSRIKMVKQNKEAKQEPALVDDELPWWLTDPPSSSPQVDLLVPAARLVLNDLLTEDIPRREIPLAIRKAVNIAAERVSGEIRLSTADIEDAVEELVGLMLGKGPLQPLYQDSAVTDIYMDGYRAIKCIRRGRALETPFRFRSQDEYESYINSMLQSVDRVLNLSSPIVDCVLSDSQRSRVNAVHSSLLDGKESAAVIRVPRLQQITFFDLLQTKTLPANLAAWLSELVGLGEANILVIGPTGSGKTVFTTALLSSVGSDERIVTIEDVPEIFVPTAHLEKLVSRPDNAQGTGSVGMEQLLRAALRRAPHRIVVGEIRDREGPLFLKALETGHAGSVATIHAHSAKDGLWRLLDVVAAHEATPQESLQRRISRSLHVLITMQRINGRPCMVEIAEVRPPVQGEFVITEIIKFDSEENGVRKWRLCTGHSEWMDRLAQKGMELRPGSQILPVESSMKEDRE